MRIPIALSDALFRPSMQQNWPRDRKLKCMSLCHIHKQSVKTRRARVKLFVLSGPKVFDFAI